MILHEVSSFGRRGNRLSYFPHGDLIFTNGDLIDRTSELRKKGYVGRRLGPKQMTTDTAVRVTRMVVQEKGD